MINQDWSIEDFVRESNMIEGIDRCDALECQVFEDTLHAPEITLEHLVKYVSVTQPNAVLRDNISIHGVRIGAHIAPPSGPEIRQRLQDILDCANSLELSPWKLHVQYESLHPFTDGNGRSGRLLWHWQMNRRFGEQMGGGLRYGQRGFLHWFYYQTLGETQR